MGCSAKQIKLKDYEKHFLKSEEAHILLALKQNYSDTYQKLADAAKLAALIPHKLLVLFFLYKSKKYQISVLLTEKIRNVSIVKDVLKTVSGQSNELSVECWRESPNLLLDLEMILKIITLELMNFFV